MFANNTFDSNIGIHGGAIHIDNIKQGASDEDSKQYSPFIYFQNNTFTRNMAYFEGNAIAVSGAQRTRSDRDFVRNDSLLQVVITDCTFKKNYGMNVAIGGAVSIDGR